MAKSAVTGPREDSQDMPSTISAPSMGKRNSEMEKVASKSRMGTFQSIEWALAVAATSVSLFIDLIHDSIFFHVL